MADLEKTIDPVLDNAEDTNPTVDQGKDFEVDLSNSATAEQKSPDFSNLFSEDVSKTETVNSDVEATSNEVNDLQENHGENTISLENSEPQPENLNLGSSLEESNQQEALAGNSNISLNQEPANNEVLLWKFESEMINTVDTTKEDVKPDSAILDHPAILENYQNIEESSPILNAEKQEKERLVQKEKLAQLVKAHETKAEKSWFTKWILSGVILTAWIVVASCIFAKDQVVNLLNGGVENNASLSANIVDVFNNTNDDEIINNEEAIDNEEIVDEEAAIDEEVIDENEIIDDEEIIDNEEVIDDEIIDDEENTNNEDVDKGQTNDKEILNDEEIDESIPYEGVTIDEIAVANDEATTNDETNEEEVKEVLKYTITHVNTEEEANWVLPAHCTDLTCYGEDTEFTECTSFKMIETLDENSTRVWNRWCRYKDSSELVHVDFF